MSTVEMEQVLVVPTELFHRLGHFQGFSRDVNRYLGELLSGEHASYRPRNEMETDPSFKQLIPYMIFRHVDDRGVASLFQYTRGRGQGEHRLHRKVSVGVGGHISSIDHHEVGADVYARGMRRELEEEVIVEAPYRERIVGLINDDDTDVGKVHLGVVHLFDVEAPLVRSREEEIVEAGFQPLVKLLQQLDAMESWSRICVAALFGEQAEGTV